MKPEMNWIVEEHDKKERETARWERTSLTKVLMTFVRLLTGVKMFCVTIPGKKSWVIYRKEKE